MTVVVFVEPMPGLSAIGTATASEPVETAIGLISKRKAVDTQEALDNHRKQVEKCPLQG